MEKSIRNSKEGNIKEQKALKRNTLPRTIIISTKVIIKKHKRKTTEFYVNQRHPQCIKNTAYL